MTYRGKVQNGVIVVEDGVRLAEGTEVCIEAFPVEEQPPSDDEVTTLYDQLAPIIGIVDDLPADMAANHDHYIHGAPKR